MAIVAKPQLLPPTSFGGTFATSTIADLVAGALVGDLVVVSWCANVGTAADAYAVTDTKNNTWVLAPGTFIASNVHAVKAYSLLTSALLDTDTISLTHGSRARRAMHVQCFSGVASARTSVAGGAVTAGSDPTITIAKQAGDLIHVTEAHNLSAGGVPVSWTPNTYTTTSVQSATGTTDKVLDTGWRVAASGTDETATIDLTTGGPHSIVGTVFAATPETPAPGFVDGETYQLVNGTWV